jgi:hypothetical protein
MSGVGERSDCGERLRRASRLRGIRRTSARRHACPSRRRRRAAGPQARWAHRRRLGRLGLLNAVEHDRVAPAPRTHPLAPPSSAPLRPRDRGHPGQPASRAPTRSWRARPAGRAASSSGRGTRRDYADDPRLATSQVRRTAGHRAACRTGAHAVADGAVAGHRLARRDRCRMRRRGSASPLLRRDRDRAARCTRRTR